MSGIRPCFTFCHMSIASQIFGLIQPKLPDSERDGIPAMWTFGNCHAEPKSQVAALGVIQASAIGCSHL